MPIQYNMNMDTVLYRGVLEYEVQPFDTIPNPDYRNPNVKGYQPYYLRVPNGPVKTETMVIGPYTDPKQIKSYITRKRERYTNLRLARAEKVSGWEKVDI